LGRLTWQVGEVVDVRPENYRVKDLTLVVPGWPGHRPGQHVDVRLTAEDGYQAVRSYSIASPSGAERISITVEAIEDGEVSPYLVEDVRPGDRIEVRGPVGGYFVWESTLGGPLLLVAGGSGIVPLMAMIRHRLATGSDIPVRLLYSVRSAEDVIYRDQLTEIAASQNGIDVIYTYTRVPPTGWDGYRRRVDKAMLDGVSWPSDGHPLVYVCGPTSFVEGAAAALVGLGHDGSLVKTERFGPSGAP
jgi:ferredoxin-NADP reductase